MSNRDEDIDSELSINYIRISSCTSLILIEPKTIYIYMLYKRYPSIN